MKRGQNFFLSRFLILLAILWGSPRILDAATWVNSTSGDVLDQDLVLDASAGPIILNPGLTSITSNGAANVTVTLVNGDVTVQAGVGGSCLLLSANGGLITFDLTTAAYDLTFTGSATSDTLQIIVEGNVNILLNGGRTISLRESTTHGGVQWIVLTQNNTEPILNFGRVDTNDVTDPNLDVTINIGTNCLLTYGAPPNNNRDAFINFCCSTGGLGRMLLTIADQGSFVIAFHTVTFADPCYAIDLIHPPSGNTGSANVLVGMSGSGACTTIPNPFAGSTPSAYLTIQNSNQHFPELLIDPFYTQNAINDPNGIGSFNGLRYGFVLGANGALNIGSGAYLDYVGLSNNNCLPITSILDVIAEPTGNCVCNNPTESVLKSRNASAFIVDGWLQPNVTPAQIILGIQSGIFFRSGVNSLGASYTNPSSPELLYTVDPALATGGAGEIVFDVEGPLNVQGFNISSSTPGSDVYNSRLEILSLQVNQSGGPLFSDNATSTFPNTVCTPPITCTFPARTFADQVSNVYLQYNKAAWLINNSMILNNVSLAHTDTNHTVCQSNDTISEPSYIGGERWFLSQMRGDNPLVPRPSISFINSFLHVYTDVAFTGLDLLVPDLVQSISSIPTEFNTLSKFIFYSNGRALENGTGRTMILGTLVGSQACDGCTVISRDSYLDVSQNQDFSASDATPGQDEMLWLTTSTNNSLIQRQLYGSTITGQTSIHEIYLGGSSNISIGEQAPSCESRFNNSSTPSLWIAGNFFNFSTKGGIIGIPDTSNVTGQGGIFVDLNGTFGIFPDYRASIATMVTKSCNGIVNLPKSQVVFDSRVGITDWKLALSTNRNTIVNTGQIYSDYTLNWVATIKDTNAFTPYELGNVNVCGCPAVIPANITALPTIKGQIDQLQIVDSRIGDAAHVMIDGGYVREMLWLSNCRPAEAPVAVVVLQNEGRLGINTAHRNVDSINTQSVLGVNGITLIANGSARIDLNDDVIINNICSILQGPNWAATDILEFHADSSHAIHVTQNGVLDLRSFTAGGTISFGENIRIVFEPGSRLILGGVVFELNNNASIEVEASPLLTQLITTLDASFGTIDNTLSPVSTAYTVPHNEFASLTGYGTGLSNTNPYRFSILGSGTMRLTDASEFFIGVGAVAGVETLLTTLPNNVVCEIATTNVTIEIDEGATFLIGRGNNDQGGSFQIGDIQTLEGHTVNFTLTLNGPDAQFALGAGAFVGFGAGVIRPALYGDVQSQVLADTLFDVGAITFNFFEGSFQAERIFNSDDPRSHSLVVGNAASFNLNFTAQGDDIVVLDTDNFGIYGGGNFFQLVPTTGASDIGAVALINRTNDTIINIPVGGTTVVDTRLFAGILASTDMLDNLNVSSISSTAFFQTLKALSATFPVTRSNGFSTIAPEDPVAFRESRTTGRLGYVDRDSIGRITIFDIIDGNGASQGDRRARAYELGTVVVSVNTTLPAPAPILTATQIQVS